MDGRHGRQAEPTYEKARLLFASIASSPPFFAALLWLGVGRTEPFAAPDVAAWIVWGLIGAGGLAVWLVFRGKAVTPMTEWPARRRRAEEFDAAVLQTRLIVAWGGAEGVGLAGVVAYFFLGGTLAMLVSSLAVSLFCLGLSAPREAWYRELEREAEAPGTG